MSKCCCCSDGLSFADNPNLVFSVYAIAFIPLACIYALDCITDRWRTIRETRRNGLTQLFVSLPSLGYVFFYVIVQINNKDYKEAAAAITVAVFNSYHVLRTIWGLVLLYEFRNWNISALRCLLRLGYGAPRYHYPVGVRKMLSTMKTCPSHWKRYLFRLVDSLKNKLLSLCNWSLSWMQPTSPVHSSRQSSSSPSASLDETRCDNGSRPSHEWNSFSTSPDSTSNGNHSRSFSGHNSFHSTVSDSTMVENVTFLRRLFNASTICMQNFFDIVKGLHGLCIDMKKSGENVCNWVVGKKEKSYLGVKSLQDIETTVDHHMVVNCSLIDNEFLDVELPVRPTIFTRLSHSDLERHSGMSRFVASCLKSRKPEECSVRWLVSFLARFGYEWLVDTRDDHVVSLTPLQRKKRQTSLTLAVIASARTTQGLLGDHGSTEKFMTLRSPHHEYCTIGNVDYLLDNVSVAQKCMLPFKMNVNFGDTMDFKKHEATIRDAAKDDWHRTSLNELESDQRFAVENITPFQLAYFSSLMEESVELGKEIDIALGEFEAPLRVAWKHSSIDVFMYQLGVDTGENSEKFFQYLPVQKSIWSTYLWHGKPNNLLLQSSVHLDNFLALDSGKKLVLYMEEYEAISLLEKSGDTRSVFDNQHDLELRRLQSDIATPIEFGPIRHDPSRFIGCVAETVRSTFAAWIAENESERPEWNAGVAPVGIRFTCSKQLCDAFSEIRKRACSESTMRSLYVRLLWEVQAHLEWVVQEVVDRKSADIRQSPFLIMLFILGFPSLDFEMTEAESTASSSSRSNLTIDFEDRIVVKPVAGPEQVSLELMCDQELQKMSLIFLPESHIFKWQDWKDAFMGRLAAQKHWRSSRLSSDRELLRTEANHSNLCSRMEFISPATLGKEYGLSYWSGWPPFMPEIANFEVRNFIENEYGSSCAKVFERDSSEFIRALKTAMDIHFLLRTDNATVYTNGHRALEDGRADEALKLFGHCIAHIGHREALKHAFDIVASRIPICNKQVAALESYMYVRFKNLLDRNQIEEHTVRRDEIDLALLAVYFGRIFKKAGSRDAGMRKALALFYENGTNSVVSDAAIEALESFIKSGDTCFAPHQHRFYLAMAQQSRFHESQNRAHQEIAVKCLMGLGNWAISSHHDDCCALHIGYLLEKGVFVGRDLDRKDAMIKAICDRKPWGDEKILRVMFDRLFVKQTSCDEADRQFNEYEHVSGIGRRPQDAVFFYDNLDVSPPECTNRVGLLYHMGANDVPPDASEAEEKYSIAIEEGNHDALCNMGVLKSDVIGGDFGISFLRTAVEAGNSTAMNNLAVTFEFGNGVNRDVHEAERLYKQAIEVNNNPVAMYNLSVLYMWGDVEVQTDRNMSEACRIISDLTAPQAELKPLYILEEQVRRFGVVSKIRSEAAISGKVEVEELDECLAYVKILEST